MKKISFAFVLAFLLLCLCRCAKPVEHVHSDNQGSVCPVFNREKSSTTYQITLPIGHSSKQCSGCVRLKNGTYIHIDCQGWGSECTVSANVSLTGSSSNLTAVTTDTFGLTDQSLFNMPDRSLYSGKDEKGNDLWLNIPAQLAVRDDSTLQFTFSGLFYTSSQYYRNN